MGPTDPAATPPGIDLRVDAQEAFLRSLTITMPTGPRFTDNGYYDTGDAAIYQAILRATDPARVVEVGGGWSTAALFDVEVTPTVTVIDPDPSRAYEHLLPGDYLLRAFLQHNDAFEILLWADLLRRLGRVDDPVLDAALARAHSAAIWIRKR